MPIKLPSDFIEMLHGLYGDAAGELVAALSDRPETSVRYNRRKFNGNEIFSDSEKVEWCVRGRYLKQRPDFIHNPLLHAGVFYVQEAASMVYQQIIEKLIEDQFDGAKGKSLYILDLCAAPGGKTTAMLDAMPDNGIMVANEYDRKRSGILKENLDKWGDDRVIITSSQASAFSPLNNLFDIIAVDAPCSGEGLMRREEMARNQWSLSLVDKCVRLQRDIVADALKCLKPGGFMIYSTCTFNRLENEENVKHFIEEYGLEPVSLQLQGTEDVARSLDPDIYGYRFLPHQVCCEGLFVAVLKKPSVDGETVFPPRPAKSSGKNEMIRIAGEDFYLETIGSRMYLLSKETLQLLNILRKERKINILAAGTEYFEIKGSLRIPSSKSVLNPRLFPKEIPCVEIDEDQAVRYLKRDSLQLAPEAPKGIVCITCMGYPLGLAKNLGNRANNLYPQEWRVKT